MSKDQGGARKRVPLALKMDSKIVDDLSHRLIVKNRMKHRAGLYANLNKAES
jgi:hypothetical protein